MEVPEVAVRWMAQHASSNLDLASLSNVNRQWRSITTATLLSSPSSLLLPSMISTILTQNSITVTANDKNNTFCAAWFPPAGIQIQQMDNGHGGEERVGEEESDSFAPSGSLSYAGSEEGQGPSLSAINFHELEEGTICSHEWRGYREAMDVLAPFGYAAAFVENVLSLAREQVSLENSTTTTLLQNGNDTGHDYTTTTVAVCGATLARPEGYCLCWDAPDVKLPPSTFVNSWEAVPYQDVFRSSLLRQKKRQMRQREVLPRVVLSSKHKNPLLPQEDSIRQQQQPCLQFLNASGRNAVRLFTPPFECGPLEGPITMFLVGIATEDGCFVSGLKTRCEVGHMHPLSLRDALIDMSSISIATDYRREQGSTSPSESVEARNRSHSADYADSDDSSCALHTGREEGMQCQCPFSDSLVNEDDCGDGPPEECIYRGQRGPGLWHLYAVVFDKQDSVIRIDGAPEPLEKGCCDGAEPAPATLDGLTIGADHCFDMSLCLGDGNGDEGEGAIAELAVFKGRLCDEDICVLEYHFMKKHGITPVTKESDVALSARQDDLKRQGRALIYQPPPWSMRVSGIPLPIMAQDRSVAWHRMNAVTGKDMRVSRIGSKFSNGSSDW